MAESLVPIVERAALWIRLVRHLLRKVRSDPLNVFHQRDGAFEDVVIDPLQNGAVRRAILMELDTVSVVDVAAAIRDGLKKLAANFKLVRHCSGDLLFAHAQRLSGYFPLLTSCRMLSTTCA